MNQHVVLMSFLNTNGNKKRWGKQDTRAGARSGACGGASARALGSSLLRCSQRADRATWATPGSPSPRSTLCPRKSCPLCLPFLGFAPEYHPHPDVAYLWQFTKLYPGTPLRWGLGTSHSFIKRLLFYSGGPRHSPGGVCRTPSISPQRWGERSIFRATGQQYPRQKRQVTGSQVTLTLQQQELQTA